MGVMNELNSASHSKINGVFRFVGSSKPECPQTGDIFYDVTTKEDYVYVDQKWKLLGCFGTENRPRKITVTRCPGCGASLPLNKVDEDGLCECRFCSRISYVYE